MNRCDAKQRVDLYIKCNEWVKAANEVRQAMSSQTLTNPGCLEYSAKIEAIEHA